MGSAASDFMYLPPFRSLAPNATTLAAKFTLTVFASDEML
jgi:hypothetical protein